MTVRAECTTKTKGKSPKPINHVLIDNKGIFDALWKQTLVGNLLTPFVLISF